MTDLLTKAEYAAIAADLDMPTTPFIDGKFRRGSGPLMPSLNPATGAVLAQISTAGSADVDLAVAKAREAFDQGHWAKMHPSARKDVLIRLGKLLTRRKHELAVLESLESGKPIRDCALIDIPETIHTLKWHAEAADKIYDQTGPSGDDAISMIVREPIGVVAAILPWNFPLMMLAWKIGPALAAGCSVIVKPAEQTSMTALRVAELAHMAGVPRGVLQVLPGDGPSVGEPLGRHMDVDMVSFTGSTDTGRRFLRYAADSNLKKSRAGMRRQEPGRGAGRCGKPGSCGRTCGECRVLEYGSELFRNFAPDRAPRRQGPADGPDHGASARLENG